MRVLDANRREIGMVLLAGAGVAAVVLLMPVGLVEMGVASSGLGEAWPAAAPPLGMKARLLLAGFAAIMTMGAIMMVRRERPVAALEQEEDRHERHAGGARLMGFAFTKLSALAKGFTSPHTEATPAVRRADAHPDAPTRAPIFASRDFGGTDIFADGREEAIIVPPAPMTSPAIAEPRSLDSFILPADIEAETTDLPIEEEGGVEAAVVAAPAIASEQPATPAPTQGMSIAQLTDRLERGLSLRSRTPAPTPTPSAARVIADMPVSPAMPVREMPSENADEALRAALGALRSMASRSR